MKERGPFDVNSGSGALVVGSLPAPGVRIAVSVASATICVSGIARATSKATATSAVTPGTPAPAASKPRGPARWNSALWNGATWDSLPPSATWESLPSSVTWESASADEAKPPVRAEFLLYIFAARRDRDALLGDLAEDFTTRLVPKYGLRVARFWYWTQVLRSIWPVLRPRLLELAGLGMLVRAARAWLSSSR